MAFSLTILNGAFGGAVGVLVAFSGPPSQYGDFGRPFLAGAIIGGIVGIGVALFAYVWPRAAEDVTRWKTWSFISFFMGSLCSGLITSCMRVLLIAG